MSKNVIDRVRNLEQALAKLQERMGQAEQQAKFIDGCLSSFQDRFDNLEQSVAKLEEEFYDRNEPILELQQAVAGIEKFNENLMAIIGEIDSKQMEQARAINELQYKLSGEHSGLDFSFDHPIEPAVSSAEPPKAEQDKPREMETCLTCGVNEGCKDPNKGMGYVCSAFKLAEPDKPKEDKCKSCKPEQDTGICYRFCQPNEPKCESQNCDKDCDECAVYDEPASPCKTCGGSGKVPDCNNCLSADSCLSISCKTGYPTKPCPACKGTGVEPKPDSPKKFHCLCGKPLTIRHFDGAGWDFRCPLADGDSGVHIFYVGFAPTKAALLAELAKLEAKR